MAWPPPSLPLCALALSACTATTPGELTTAIGGELPHNGKVVVFVRPPLDVTFARVDQGATESLEHTTIGSGSSIDDVAYLIDPGDVEQGETITVNAVCAGCSEVGDVTFTRPDDVTAPTLALGPFALSARGDRRSPYDVLISSYEVTLTTQGAEDESAFFFRFQGDELDVLRQPNGNDVGFRVDGRVERTLCMKITMVDVAGNEATVSENACVRLDASTARDFAEPPPPPG